MQLTATQSSESDINIPTTNSEVWKGQRTTGRHHVQNDLEFYDLFLARCAQVTTVSPLTSVEIAENLNLGKTQVDTWLKRAVSDKAIKRLTRPVRYQSNDPVGTQASLLSNVDL